MTIAEIMKFLNGGIAWLAEANILNFLIFLGLTLISLLIGRFTPRIVRWFIDRFFADSVVRTYDTLIQPIKNPLRVSGTLILISLSAVWLEDYKRFYKFISPFLDLALIASIAWLVSKLLQQVLRLYGIDMLKRMGLEVDELLLVFETVANVFIGFFAVLAYAQSQKLNLLGLFAGLGFGGLAIVAATQKILEQVLSTIVLYLDRPFVPGDYIRLKDGQLGRVESIGIRSTKIRTSAKSTLFVVPNSILVNIEIENLTRAKKVMSMIYLDFLKPLDEQDMALVREVVTDSTNSVFGIDPGSTNITFNQIDGDKALQARVTFFILGSNENSIQLRKRLLELANETISQKLSRFGIEFSSKEPTVYVESPITL